VGLSRFTEKQTTERASVPAEFIGENTEFPLADFHLELHDQLHCVSPPFLCI
jgi:hypothetical protein